MENPTNILTCVCLSYFVIGRVQVLQMGFQDVVFLSSRAVLCSIFLENCGWVYGLVPPHILKLWVDLGNVMLTMRTSAPKVINVMLTMSMSAPNVINVMLSLRTSAPNVINDMLTISMYAPNVVNVMLAMYMSAPNVISLVAFIFQGVDSTVLKLWLIGHRQLFSVSLQCLRVVVNLAAYSYWV